MEYLSLYQNNILDIATNIFGAESIITSFVQSHPIIAISILLLIPILIFGGFTLFFDFIVDAWKMPFGLALDILIYLGINDVKFIYFAIGLAPIVFFGLIQGKNKILGIWTTIVSIIASALFLFLDFPALLSILAIIPINTAIMFVGCILD